MVCQNKYGLILLFSVLWLYGQANPGILDTLPVSEKKEIEGRFYDRAFLGSKNTYGDFDSKEKEYLVYPNSPTQFFLGTNLWQDLSVNFKIDNFPTLVDHYTIGVLPNNSLPTVIVGYFSSSIFSMQFQYYNRELEEQIFAQTVAGSPYSIKKRMDLKGFTLALARDINIVRLAERVYLVGAYGFEVSWANIRFRNTSSFQFEDRESLETILGNAVDINFDDNRVAVNVEQQIEGISGLIGSPFWQIGFDIPVSDQFTIYLRANNLIPINFYLRTTTSFENTPDEDWEANFKLQYNHFELKNRSIQFSLSYRISQENRSKRKLKL